MEKHEFNIFPEMNPEDYNRLINDIKENGYDEKQPIYLYEGKIIDGWNRQKACDTLGIKPTYMQFVGTKSDAILYIMRTNKRRNLTSSQWAAIAAEADEIWDVIQKQVEDERVKKISEQMKDNENASKEKQTVQLIVPSEKDTTRLTDHRIAETFNTNRSYVSDAKKLKTENPDVFEQVKSGKTTLSKVKKQQKSEKRQQERKDRMIIPENLEFKPDIRKGRFQDICLDIPDNSIDHIITDPPYPEEFLDDWYDLGKVAKRILKPGGFCIAYSGKYHMVDVLKRMTENIDFYWQLILIHTGSLSAVHPVKINTGYKPIFIFNKPPRQPQFDYVKDVITGTGTEKFGHEWQQSEGELDIILKNFTKPGDLILDPFAGSGTTGFACMKNKRRSILIDINDV